MPPRHDYSHDVIQAVSTWEGINVEPHRFGGREFKMGKVEIGHIHRGGMLDIPYTVALRQQLVEEGKTGLHHLLADSGWTTTHIHTADQVAQGLWLLRVSWLQKRLGRARRDAVALAQLQQEADELALSPALHGLLFGPDDSV
jgi:hypothetical protein